MAVLVDYRGKPAYDIYVKGSPEVPELGDCKPLVQIRLICVVTSQYGVSGAWSASAGHNSLMIVLQNWTHLPLLST